MYCVNLSTVMYMRRTSYAYFCYVDNFACKI